MLAMRVRQKEGTFYLVNFKAKDILSKVRFLSRAYNEGEEPPKRVRDTEIASFIAGVEHSDRSFQRALRERKVGDIVNFLENAQQQPLIPAPVLLFTHEVLEFMPMGAIQTQGDLSCPSEPFIIIDGQHRLAGLKVFCQRHHEEADTIEVPAIVFDGKQEGFAAEMFVIINSTQTRINKSHLVDLLDKVTTNASPEKKWAAWIVKCLYENVRSPLQYKINMLGGHSHQEKWVMQSELFNEIYRLVARRTKDDEPGEMHRFIATEFGWDRRGCAPEMFIDYFQAVKLVMSSVWGNNKYMFTSAVTIKALVRALGKLIEDAEVRKAWNDEKSPNVFVARISAWADMADDFRREGFYERFAAKGQVERVGRILTQLEKRIAKMATIN